MELKFTFDSSNDDFSFQGETYPNSIKNPSYLFDVFEVDASTDSTLVNGMNDFTFNENIELSLGYSIQIHKGASDEEIGLNELIIDNSPPQSPYQLEHEKKGMLNAKFDKFSSYCLGHSGWETVFQRERLEVPWLSQNIESGHFPSFLLLGLLYWRGIDCKSPDHKKAYELYLSAAKLDCVEAMEIVAECLDHGKGVEMDKGLGDYWRHASRCSKFHLLDPALDNLKSKCLSYIRSSLFDPISDDDVSDIIRPGYWSLNISPGESEGGCKHPHTPRKYQYVGMIRDWIVLIESHLNNYGILTGKNSITCIWCGSKALDGRSKEEYIANTFEFIDYSSSPNYGRSRPVITNVERLSHHDREELYFITNNEFETFISCPVDPNAGTEMSVRIYTSDIMTTIPSLVDRPGCIRIVNYQNNIIMVLTTFGEPIKFVLRNSLANKFWLCGDDFLLDTLCSDRNEYCVTYRNESIVFVNNESLIEVEFNEVSDVDSGLSVKRVTLTSLRGKFPNSPLPVFWSKTNIEWSQDGLMMYISHDLVKKTNFVVYDLTNRRLVVSYECDLVRFVVYKERVVAFMHGMNLYFVDLSNLHKKPIAIERRNIYWKKLMEHFENPVGPYQVESPLFMAFLDNGDFIFTENESTLSTLRHIVYETSVYFQIRKPMLLKMLDPNGNRGFDCAFNFEQIAPVHSFSSVFEHVERRRPIIQGRRRTGTNPVVSVGSDNHKEL